MGDKAQKNMKLITVIAASALGSTQLPRKRNGLDDAMLVSQKGSGDHAVEPKTYEERMVGILDNCGFFDESVEKCAKRLSDDMEFYTPVKFSYPTAAWKSYAAEASRYYIYG